MFRFVFLILLSVAVAVITYLPYVQNSTHLVAQHLSLHMEMNHVVGLMTDRQQPDRSFRFHSQHMVYDEAEQSTQLFPFAFMGRSAGNDFKGESNHALIKGDTFTLNQQVRLEQASNTKATRNINTEQLIIDINQHQLTSPGPLTLTDSKERIQADSLTGNYEAGWYEFTQHVHSYWQ